MFFAAAVRFCRTASFYEHCTHLILGYRISLSAFVQTFLHPPSFYILFLPPSASLDVSYYNITTLQISTLHIAICTMHTLDSRISSSFRSNFPAFSSNSLFILSGALFPRIRSFFFLYHLRQLGVVSYYNSATLHWHLHLRLKVIFKIQAAALSQTLLHLIFHFGQALCGFRCNA